MSEADTGERVGPRIASVVPAEQTALHTQILRLTLANEEARAYWPQSARELPMQERVERGFEERWFGSRSVDRVKLLLANFALRFDAFPDALAVLSRWRTMDPSTRTLICHWHLQLADPIYRQFTGELLVQRRARLGDSRSITRDSVIRWVDDLEPGRWATATLIQFANKLLKAATEAGLVSGSRDTRAVALPRVPDEALLYLLHLLRDVRIDGSLLDNPYLASVGLVPDIIDRRLQSIAGISVRRMGAMVETVWEYGSLRSWGTSVS